MEWNTDVCLFCCSRCMVAGILQTRSRPAPGSRADSPGHVRRARSANERSPARVERQTEKEIQIMMELVVFAVIALLLLAALLILAREHREPQETAPQKSLLPVEEWFPRHARYFAPIRRAISEDDVAYLSRKVGPASRRRARADQHHVTREYLAGLREDFVHVERLSRTLAALSPKVSRSLERERVWLGLQFRSLYGLAWLRLQTGLNCRESLERLTNVVAYLASRADAVAAGLEQISAQSA